MGDPSSFVFLISMPLMILVMYLLIYRPQAQKQKAREQMIKQVGKGDRILTTGGFYGSVVALKGEKVLVVRFGDNRPFEVTREAVATVLPPEPGSAGE